MKPFKLNWNETEVKLGQGRFSHFLRKPSKETLFEREIKKIEIPVSKNGKVVKEIDLQEDERDAALYQEHKTKEPTGYPSNVPETHFANAFRGIFNCTFRFAEDSDILADVFVIEQVFGDEDEPDFIIRHLLKQPDKKNFDSMQKAINNGRFEPGKNGKKVWVITSFLEKAMTFYAEHLVKIEGAFIQDEQEIYFSDENKSRFIDETIILFQRAVVEVAISEIHSAAQD